MNRHIKDIVFMAFLLSLLLVTDELGLLLLILCFIFMIYMIINFVGLFDLTSFILLLCILNIVILHYIKKYLNKIQINIRSYQFIPYQSQLITY